MDTRSGLTFRGRGSRRFLGLGLCSVLRCLGFRRRGRLRFGGSVSFGASIGFFGGLRSLAFRVTAIVDVPPGTLEKNPYRLGDSPDRTGTLRAFDKRFFAEFLKLIERMITCGTSIMIGWH